MDSQLTKKFLDYLPVVLLLLPVDRIRQTFLLILALLTELGSSTVNPL